MNTTTTPQKPPFTIGHTNTVPHDPATKPYRFVLRFLGAGMTTPYVTHLETLNEDGSHDGYHHGDYCRDMLTGYASLVRRAQDRHLKIYDAQGVRIPSQKL